MSGAECGTKEQTIRKGMGLHALTQQIYSCELIKGTLYSSALFHVMAKRNDLDILQGVLNAIADTLDVDQIEFFIDYGLVGRLFQIGQQKYKQILHPLLRIVSMITNGTDAQTESLITFGGIEFIFDVLADPKTDNYCKTKSLWILSNIVVGPYEHREKIFSNKSWVEIIFGYAKQGHLSVGNRLTEAKREAIYGLCNSTKGAPQQHIKFLIDCGFLSLLKTAIQEQMNDSRFLLVVIYALLEILSIGHNPSAGVPNAFQAQLETCGLVDELEKLQTHSNRSVYTTVIDLIERYFEVEDPI